MACSGYILTKLHTDLHILFVFDLLIFILNCFAHEMHEHRVLALLQFAGNKIASNHKWSTSLKENPGLNVLASGHQTPALKRLHL